MHFFLFALLGIAVIFLIFFCAREQQLRLEKTLTIIKKTFEYHNELNRSGVLERIKFLPQLPPERKPKQTRLLLTFPFPGYK